MRFLLSEHKDSALVDQGRYDIGIFLENRIQSKCGRGFTTAGYPTDTYTEVAKSVPQAS